MKLLSITPSTKADKKLMAIFDNDGRRKTVHFGQKNADDFLLTKNVEQKNRYQTRHRKDLDTKDPSRAGYLSWYILWNKPTLTESIRDYRQRFNL
jgi:hypothetical protein